MVSLDASGETFTKVVKGQNFMTPNTIGYAKFKNGIAEVCSGNDFLGMKMYGVTVVKDGQRDDDLGKCLHSMEEVHAYLETLGCK